MKEVRLSFSKMYRAHRLLTVMVLTKNKKITYLFSFILVFGTVFFVTFAAPEALAQDAGTTASIQNGEANTDNFLVVGVKYILYFILLLVTGLVQVAASVFAWATRPEYISGPTGLLNLVSVYELWKFIRDFFNLFFIFLLLFSAFATVFQIEKFNLKKNFFHIVGAAIAINFSFPLTRIIIDLGNVPMYFFAQGLVNASGAGGNSLLAVPMSFFQSTGMASFLTPGGASPTSGSFSELLTAVIFSFIFMITLFSLAILFIIRLLKLVILLIFSPLGLAASIIPGLEKFGKQWWGELFKTVFFGPAAMLMVVIALRFSQEITTSEFMSGVSASAPSSTSQSQSSIISQGVFFIPIILMWMAMHVGSKFGIEGSNAVMKKADAVAAWGKKQLLFSKGSYTRRATGAAAAPLSQRLKGYRSGIKDRFSDTPIIGADARKKKSEEREAIAKARAKGFGTKDGMNKEVEKAKAGLRDKRAREQERKWKDDGKTVSEIASKLTDDKATDVEKLAAASFLANEKDGIKDPKVLADALTIANETNKKDLYDKILANADADSLDLDRDQIDKVKKGYKDANYKKSDRRDGESDIDYNARLAKEEKDFDEALEGKFRAKFKKEGKMKVLIDYDIAKQPGVSPELIYAKYMSKMKVKEIAQMKGVVDKSGKLDDQYVNYIKERIRKGEWKLKDQQDAFAELDQNGKKAWKKAGIDPTHP